MSQPPNGILISSTISPQLTRMSSTHIHTDKRTFIQHLQQLVTSEHFVQATESKKYYCVNLTAAALRQPGHDVNVRWHTTLHSLIQPTATRHSAASDSRLLMYGPTHQPSADEPVCDR